MGDFWFDINSEKWVSIWKLDPNNPYYYETLFKYFKNLCLGLGFDDLIKQLDNIIYEKIEKLLGADIRAVLFTYKNLPSLNSITKPLNPDYPNEYVYKYEIKRLLDDVEVWIFERLVEFEEHIRFKDTQKIY